MFFLTLILFFNFRFSPHRVVSCNISITPIYCYFSPLIYIYIYLEVDSYKLFSGGYLIWLEIKLSVLVNEIVSQNIVCSNSDTNEANHEQMYSDVEFHDFFFWREEVADRCGRGFYAFQFKTLYVTIHKRIKRYIFYIF